jgi:hypothetical protein
MICSYIVMLLKIKPRDIDAEAFTQLMQPIMHAAEHMLYRDNCKGHGKSAVRMAESIISNTHCEVPQL